MITNISVPMKRKISIKDIASRLNISTTTVSFVINGKSEEKHISKEVAAKVNNLVAQLGFRPNSFAKGLRTGKSYTIGFLVDSISDPFFFGIAGFLEQMAASKGYKILFSSIGKEKNKFSELLEIFTERRVDGYIIAAPEGIEQEIKTLIKTGTPVVLFDRYLPDVSADYVLVDNFASTFKATKHLIDNGYRRCAFITVKTDQQQMVDRLSGYRQAILENGGREAILKINYSLPGATVAEIQNFIDSENPEAIIFGANYITMEGIRSLNTAPGKIRDDIGLVSFDDFELLEYISPPVTAIEQPLEKIAQNIMTILLSKLLGENNHDAFFTMNIPCKLNERNSSVQRFKTVKL